MLKFFGRKKNMSVKLKVNAGPHARNNCPVSAQIPWSGDAPNALSLTSSSGSKIPAQIICACEDTLHILFILPGLDAGQAETLTVSAVEEEFSKVACVEDEDGVLSLQEDGTEITRYNFGPKWVRPFFYPVIGPDDTRVTRGYPVVDDIEGESQDHVHHKSIWFAHGEVNGVDNWSEQEGHGGTKHVSFGKTISGPACCGFTSDNDWVSKDGKKIISQKSKVKMYSTTPDERIFDFAVTFTATEGDVVFGDTKEGGILSVRVATTMDGNKGGLIENSYGGLTESENWGHRAPWCDYTGPVDGKQVGIAILDHKDNPLYPTYWHVRDYGLMTANPFALSYYKNDKSLDGSWTLSSGQSATFRYRLLLHKGNACEGKVKAKYLDYIAPPKVEIE